MEGLVTAKSDNNNTVTVRAGRRSDRIKEFVIQGLNQLVVVDFSFISVLQNTQRAVNSYASGFISQIINSLMQS